MTDDNVVYLASRRPVVPDDVTPEEFDALVDLIEGDWHDASDLAAEIVAAGWRPTAEGGAA